MMEWSDGKLFLGLKKSNTITNCYDPVGQICGIHYKFVKNLSLKMLSLNERDVQGLTKTSLNFLVSQVSVEKYNVTVCQKCKLIVIPSTSAFIKKLRGDINDYIETIQGGNESDDSDY